MIDLEEGEEKYGKASVPLMLLLPTTAGKQCWAWPATKRKMWNASG